MEKNNKLTRTKIYKETIVNNLYEYWAADPNTEPDKYGYVYALPCGKLRLTGILRETPTLEDVLNNNKLLYDPQTDIYTYVDIDMNTNYCKPEKGNYVYDSLLLKLRNDFWLWQEEHKLYLDTGITIEDFKTYKTTYEKFIEEHEQILKDIFYSYAGWKE